MMWPPSLLRIFIHEDGHRRVNLWLPLILLWPLVLALGIALAPIALIVACCWPRGLGKTILFGGPRLFSLFCALRGLDVQVQQTNQHVCISFR